MTTELERSAFLADLTSKDRRIGRILLTLPLGALAALVAGIIAGGVVFFAFAVLSGDPGAGDRLMQATRDPAVLASSLTFSLFVFCILAAANGAMALAFTAVGAGLMTRRLRSYFTAAPRFRWRLMLAGLVLFAAIGAPLYLGLTLLDPTSAKPPILTQVSTLPGRLAYALATTVLLLIAAAAEELVFRGWLLKLTAAFLRRPWPLLILNGLLFAAIHMDPNLDAFLVRMAMGMGLGWMTLRLGGIEFAIGAHAANNILILLLVRPMTLTDPPHAFEPSSLVVAPLMLLAFITLAEFVVRVGPLRRWTRAEIAST